MRAERALTSAVRHGFQTLWRLRDSGMNDSPLDFAIEGHKPTAIVALATGVVERVGAVRRLKQAGTRARGVPEKELRVHRRAAAAAGSQGRAAPADPVIEACKNVEAQTSRSTRRPWCTESGD